MRSSDPLLRTPRVGCTSIAGTVAHETRPRPRGRTQVARWQLGRTGVVLVAGAAGAEAVHEDGHGHVLVYVAGAIPPLPSQTHSATTIRKAVIEPNFQMGRAPALVPRHLHLGDHPARVAKLVEHRPLAHRRLIPRPAQARVQSGTRLSLVIPCVEVIPKTLCSPCTRPGSRGA